MMDQSESPAVYGVASEEALNELEAIHLLLCESLDPVLAANPARAMDGETAGRVEFLLCHLKATVLDLRYYVTGEEVDDGDDIDEMP